MSYFPTLIEESEVSPYLDRSAPAETSTTAHAERSLLYHYMIQEGCIEDVLLEGTGPLATAFSIPKGILSFPSGVALPPLFITHGSKDDKVPIEQSIAVVESMEAKGHCVEWHPVADADYLFDTVCSYKSAAFQAWLQSYVSSA